MAQNPMSVDTLYGSLSLPELQSYRDYYIQQLDKLEEQKLKLIDRGIEDGERMLQSKPDVKMVDDILIRLANLYYYKEKDEYLLRMKEFDEALEKYETGEVQNLPVEPKLNFKKSFSIYQRIIDEFPTCEMIDDALYNMGFLYEEMELYEKANQVYRHLIEAYSESSYIPEANMRLGEYYFNPPINDLIRAIYYYKNVLKNRKGPRYREALYKIGWSYYRLSQYPEAISYFTMLIEDTKAEEKIKPKELSKSADLYEEAITYIAISFLDFGGLKAIKEYFQKIGNPRWSFEVIEKMGDIYKDEKEEYQRAIAVYQMLLGLTQHSLRAPVIQDKIVVCYQSLDDQKNAFLARQRLFQDFQIDGEWWNQTRDEKAKYEAYRLTEEAMRENINYIIRRAEELQDRILFEKAVEYGKVYLITFPEDLYAYLIRWNVALILDTKLHRHLEALHEYLTISMVYHTDEYENFARSKGLAGVQDAAENAIVVADTLVQFEKKTKNTLRRSGSISSDDSLFPIESREALPLTTAVKWLATAYENYLKLFPFDQKTPVILANAGALYYTHNQFTEALKYFKTLVKYFPNSEQVHKVQYSILESYFGKQDYQSAEALAKRILAGDYSDDLKKKVEKRMGEAIFLKAQDLARAGDSEKAASEFYRMVLAAPQIDFADRALYNAAQEYESIQNYAMAIRAYESIRTTYGGSPLLKDALNNLALNYSEVGNFQLAAERYEELASMLKEGEEEKIALYNSFIFYVKSENWIKAIEMGEQYVDRYPDAEDSPAVYFEVGKYCKFVKDFEKMTEIYNNYHLKYPNSLLCVEVYFELGKHYYEQEVWKKAENGFYLAYFKNESLKQQGLGNKDYIAAEALYFSCQILNKEYRNIQFRLPEEVFKQTIEKKQDLMSILLERYTNLIAFQGSHLPETLYRIGEIYENYGETWADQQLPELDPTAKAVRQKEIHERTTQIYSQALESYKKGVEILGRLVTSGIKDSNVSDSFSPVTSDTLGALTRSWLVKIKEKVSETLFSMAEINNESIEHILEAPIPQELSEVEKLEYRSQVLLKAVKPLVQSAVNAHHRNLLVADSLILENQWTTASKVKIIETLYLLDQKYKELTFDAIELYRDKYQKFCELAWDSDDPIEENIVNDLVNMIEIAKSYSRASIVFRGEAFKEAGGINIEEHQLFEGREDLIEFALLVTDSLKRFISSGLEDQVRAETIFKETSELRYEEILAAFEDNVYFLEENLRSLLEEAYRVELSFDDRTQSRFLLEVELIKLDVDTYADSLGIQVEAQSVPTDTTWLYTTQYYASWKNVAFIGGDWIPARVDSNNLVLDQGSNGLQITNMLSLPEDSSFYIRKMVSIPGIPIRGTMDIHSDSDAQIFFNGVHLKNEVSDGSMTLTSLLQNGENVIGLEFHETDSFSIFGGALIHYIPEEVYANLGNNQ